MTNTGIYIVEPEVIEDVEDNVAIGFPDIIEKEIKDDKYENIPYTLENVVSLSHSLINEILLKYGGD